MGPTLLIALAVWVALNAAIVIVLARHVRNRPEPRHSGVRSRNRAAAVDGYGSLLLSRLLIQACRVIDADRIVLGGSVASLYPLMAARVGHYIQSMQEASFPMPDIVMNDDETVGPAFGVACMLHQRYLSLESQRFAEDGG